MNIRIYQINNERDEKNALFLRFDSLEKFTGSQDVDSSIYDKVYEGNVDCHNLEEVFNMFNLNRPPEFTGHSLSVSDVVEICHNSSSGEPGFYFCDSFGFKKIKFNSEKTQIKDERKIKVVMVEPEKPARIVDLCSDLDAMQHAVRGFIETMCPFEDEVAIVCNEEGKMTGLPLNRAVYIDGEMVDIIAGTFFICATPSDSENFESLTDEQAQKYLKMYERPEKFYRVGDEITAVKQNLPLKERIADAEQQSGGASKTNEEKNIERDI